MNNDEHLHGGEPAEEELDLIEAVDEDGNSVLLEVVRYFFYNGEEYVVLGEAPEGHDCCGCEECDHHHEDDDDEEIAINHYIMKVIEKEEDGEEIEEFEPVEDEALFEQLCKVVEADFAADESFDDK